MLNINREIESIIDAYVNKYRLIYKKIAHGQWVIALNRDDNAMNK